jgi:hypothetical protein
MRVVPVDLAVVPAEPPTTPVTADRPRSHCWKPRRVRDNAVAVITKDYPCHRDHLVNEVVCAGWGRGELPR